MCGRFTISKEKDEVVEFIKGHFHISEINDINLPRYNIGPGQDILTVLFDGENYRVGLIPWDYRIKYKDQYKQVINARSETVDERYSFKKAFFKNRCLIIADGFYEWDQTNKQPYRIIKKNQDLYFYAGIYDMKIIDGEKRFGALILTTSANDLIASHHSRMPVILDGQSAKHYLDRNLDLDELKSLLKSYPSDQMDIYPVGKDVNYIRNDYPELIKKTTND
jgi:putative SOS response-associated peptidase YedK